LQDAVSRFQTPTAPKVCHFVAVDPAKRERRWEDGHDKLLSVSGSRPVMARSCGIAMMLPLPQSNEEPPRCRHPQTAALDPGCVKTLKQSPPRNKRIELATPANPSCASGILFESILRSNDSQNGFHTAKTPSRHRCSCGHNAILARTKVQYADGPTSVRASASNVRSLCLPGIQPRPTPEPGGPLRPATCHPAGGAAPALRAARRPVFRGGWSSRSHAATGPPLPQMLPPTG
jgi:hypothetical protein